MAYKHTSRSTRIYGRSGQFSHEAIPLVVAFLVGTIGGIALKMVYAPILFAAAFAAAVLVAYAVYTYLATPLRMDAETIGDNSYYLGFLFTLTSLAVTLYNIIGASANDRAALIPEIISGFGVALSSTIVGVFLRVLMLQLKVDIESRERRARMDLDEAARRFRTELGISLDKVKGFSTESVQQAAEREAHMRQAFDTLMADMQAELLKSAEQFGPALREAVRTQTEGALNNVTAVVNEAGRKAAQQIGAAMTEMSGIAQLLAEKNIAAATKVAQRVEKLAETANKLATASETTTTALMISQTRLEQYASALSKRVEADSQSMADALVQAREAIEGGSRGYVRAAKKAGTNYDTAGQTLSDIMAGSSGRIAASVEQVSQTIVSAAGQIEAATRRLDEAMQVAADRLLQTPS